MVGKTMPGFSPVPRFRPDCIYHICQSHLDPYEEYVVGVFLRIKIIRPKRTHEAGLHAYVFRVLADNRTRTNLVSAKTRNNYEALISKNTIDTYYIRKISEDELPLFVSSARVTPDFESMLKKGKIRKRPRPKARRRNP